MLVDAQFSRAESWLFSHQSMWILFHCWFRPTAEPSGKEQRPKGHHSRRDQKPKPDATILRFRIEPLHSLRHKHHRKKQSRGRVNFECINEQLGEGIKCGRHIQELPLRYCLCPPLPQAR